jgi:hypothetical protein
MDCGPLREVEQLNFWQTDEHCEGRANLQELERTFKLKVSHNDQVELQLRQRRTKGRSVYFRHTSEDSSQDKVSMKRLKDKQMEELARERCRHTRDYEAELATSYAQQTAEIKRKLAENDQLRSEVCEIRRSLISLKLEQKHLKTEHYRRVASERESRQSVDSMASYLVRKTALLKELHDKQQQYEEVEAKLKEHADELSSRIVDEDTDIRRLKSQVRLIRKTQIKHFKELLAEGTDSRSSGLEWVVRELWSFGVSVTEDMFPGFLDSLAVHALLNLAEKKRQVEWTQVYLTEIMKMKQRQGTSKDRFNDIQTRLRGLSQAMKAKTAVVKFDRVTRTNVVHWELIDLAESSAKDPEVFEHYPDILTLENDIEECKDVLRLIQENELRRLTHECVMNNYEGKFSTHRKTVMSAIVGVDSIDRYLLSLGKEQRLLENLLTNTKTFKIGQGN